MKTMMYIAAAAGLVALTACGGQGDDKLGDQVEQSYDNKADALDAAAENATTEAQEESMQDQADALRDVGKAKEEAIDDADVNASVVNTQM